MEPSTRGMSPRFRLRDPFSGLSHLVGAGLSIAGLVVLVCLTAGKPWHVTAFSIYGASMIALYLASAVYHLVPGGPRRVEKLLVWDQVGIYLLIAGTYTPFLVGPLRGPWGYGLLAAEWTLAALGVAAKVRFGFRWRRLSTAVYVGMGWLAVVAVGPLVAALGARGVAWLLAGGVCYTAGVAFYATDARLRYGHAVWHLFVAGGSACHVWAALRHGGGVG
jgi:hemolysin III